MIRKILRDEIQRSGPIPFDRFMDFALYHAEHGYYSQKIRTGREGDYYTSAQTGSLLGEILALQIHQMHEWIEEDFMIAECGGGSGKLTKSVLKALKFEPHSYYFIDRSSAAREKALEMKREFPHLRVLSDVSELPHGFRGVIFSNELFDSFPFHRIKKMGNDLREIYVDVQDDGFVEVLGKISDPVILSSLSEAYIRLRDGDEIEVNLLMLKWLELISQKLVTGFILTIDYGYTSREWHSFEKPEGTALAYKEHRLDKDLLAQPGEQDITAHINFSSLHTHGQSLGFRSEIFASQSSFILSLGEQHLSQKFSSLSETPVDRVRLAGELQTLTHPSLMGERFKILIQSKGFSKPLELKGGKISNRISSL